MKVKLKELGTISTGNTPSKNISEFYDSEDIGFVKPDIISDLQIEYIVNTSEYLSEAARTKARIVKKDAVFVTCIGSIGKVGIAKGSEFAFNQQINAIEPNEKILSKYLAYSILANKKKLQAIANAPVVPIINKTQFGEFEVDITDDVDEQGKIVELLDKVCTIIADRKSELEKLDELIKARFVECFGDQKYPEIPLIELIEDGAGLSYGIVVPGDNVEDGVPMIRPSDFENDNLCLNNVYRVAPEIEVKYARTRLIGNEILVQVIGQPGQIMLSDDRCKGMNVTRNLAVIRPDCNRINRIYLKTYMQTQEAQAFMLGEAKQSTLKQLPLGRLKELEVPVPSMGLQNQFATFVEQTDKSKIVVQKSLDETQRLFDSLMQKYFG